MALENYKVGLAALERTKAQGPTLLLAIKAHQDALKVRDASRKPAGVADASFLDELTKELDQSQGELRSDRQLDKDLDATAPSGTMAEFAAADRQAVDEGILQEFRNAA